MRIAVIADIHANLAALEAVLDDIDSEEITEIISLGDNIGYGPDPDEVIGLLVEHDIFSIQGNHEYGLLNAQYFDKLNPDPKKSLKMTRNMLSQESLSWIQSLEQVHIHRKGRFVHGCPPKSQTAYLFYPSSDKLERIINSFPEMVCFYGHTHTLNFFEEGKPPEKGLDVMLGTRSLAADKQYIINPGSVGQPRDTINNHAKYLIWDMDRSTVTFKAVAYDVMRTVHKLRLLDFPEFNATRLLR